MFFIRQDNLRVARSNFSGVQTIKSASLASLVPISVSPVNSITLHCSLDDL